MTRDERDELIWLYAAGALGDAEMQTVRALLEAGDAEDLASLLAARETLARLPEALDGVEPSDAVLANLIKRVGPAPVAGASAPVHGPTRRWMLPTLLTAAAACVAVVATLSAISAHSEAERVRQQLDESLAALESMRSKTGAEISELRSAMEAQRVASARQMDELLAQARLLYTANLKFTSLEGQDLPRGGGRVVWDQANRKSHVFVFDLAPLPEGKVYELWFIEPDKAPVPAGTFTVDAKGNGQIVSPIPEGMDNIQVAAITEEPAGGSATPTMPIKLLGKVQ